MHLSRAALRRVLFGCTIVLTTAPGSVSAAGVPGANGRAAEAQGLGDEAAGRAEAAQSVPAQSVPEARRALASARGDAARLRGVLDRKKRQLEAALAATPEYRAALAARNRARAAYEAARRPVLAAARTGDRHLAARRRLAAAKQSLAEATRSARIGAGEAIKLINDGVRQAEAAMAAIEAEAVDADPRVADARAALDEAEEALAALRREHVDAALEQDPLAQSARASLASAEERVDAAAAELERLRATPEPEDGPYASAGAGYEPAAYARPVGVFGGNRSAARGGPRGGERPPPAYQPPPGAPATSPRASVPPPSRPTPPAPRVRISGGSVAGPKGPAPSAPMGGA